MVTVFISHVVVVLVGGEQIIRSSITVSLDIEDISSVQQMAETRGCSFSAMATILLLQGRARLAEMESRHTTAMESKSPSDKGHPDAKPEATVNPANTGNKHKVKPK